jgi:hypothetical protein
MGNSQKRHFCLFMFLCAITLVSGCSGIAIEAQNPWIEADLSPPQLLSFIREAEGTIILGFNEEVSPISFQIAFGPAIEDVQTEGKSLRVIPGAGEIPGTAYLLEGFVKDGNANSLGLTVPFWGKNNEIPKLIINEFLPQGSSSHPDFIEFAILSDGDLAGLCVADGTSGSREKRFVFPACRVHSGEFVVLFMGKGGEEAGAKLPAGTKFWCHPEAPGLSGNNGCIVLSANPEGEILDAVLYSNRSVANEDDYGGFGSLGFYASALALSKGAAWLFDAELKPEDCVNPTGTTSTRSIGRNPDRIDTNGKADWAITITRGASPGASNSSAIYEPE